ncbi:MAG: GNAT family N-acetyltransferase [Methylothermaceae bacterium]|nr:GNAT family N-acetyltransferase [Methylothermaceae bacterium]
MPIKYTIRSAQVGDEAQIAQVQVDTWRFAYANIIDHEFLANLPYEGSEKKWQKIIKKQAPFFVADIEGRVVGFVVGGKSRIRNENCAAEIFALYIYPKYQNLGIGRSLLGRMTKELYESGFAELHLQVLSGNSATQFYESCGWSRIGDGKFEIGGKKYDVILYCHDKR